MKMQEPILKPGDRIYALNDMAIHATVLKARKAPRRTHQNIRVRQDDGQEFDSLNTCWWPLK